jgi:hypothetical protein
MANGMEVDLACVGVRKINQALHKGRSGCTGFEGTGRGVFHAIPDLRAAKRADRRLHDSIRRVGDIAPQLTLGAKQALNLLEQSGLPNKTAADSIRSHSTKTPDWPQSGCRPAR